jgi:hypothetical protein
MCTVNLDQIIAIPDLAHRSLMLVLAWRYANHHHQAWPGLESLAKAVNLGRSTVQRAMVEMERLGYFTRRRRRGSTVYTVADRYFGKSQFGTSRSPAPGPEPYQRNQEISQGGDISLAEPSSENTTPPPSQNARGEGERTRKRPSGEKGEPAAARQRPRARKRHRRSATHKTPITGWAFGPADHSFAKERGFNDLRIRQMAEQFYNHAFDHGRRSADWPAAWRYWVIRAVDLDKRYGDKRTRDERRAESTRRSDEAIFRAAQRSAARHGASDRGWSQTIAGNAAG